MSKIIVVGDSIAYGKWDSEGGWVARLRKYIDTTYNIGKGGNFQVYNLGIPGEVVPRIAERFETELTMRIPLGEKSNGRNVVIFAVGINDSCPNNWMTKKQTPESVFKEKFNDMITLAQKNNCAVIVLGLTPVNSSKSKGLLFTNEEVTKYEKYITDICTELELPKITLFGHLSNHSFSELLVDAVHPNDEGHRILFESVKNFLETENFLDHVIS